MKYISKVAFVIILSLLIFSCDNNEEIISNKDNIVNLKKDKKFIELINNKVSTIENIKDIEKVNYLIEKKELNENELNELAIALGFSNINDYILYIENEYKTQNYLDKEYNISKIEPFDMEIIVSETLQSSFQLKSDDCNCERIRRNCLGEAFAASVIGHVGCASLDLAVLPGIICHAAVLSAQYFASDNCNANAENCVNNCN